MKKIPIGVEDFKKIIEENYYYVDKTNLIEKIVKDGAEVKLFTRPRRFGKTLNMSTLKYFFDIKEREKNRELFKGLYIENSPVFSEQGKYPVIFISMKEIKGITWEEMQISLKKVFSNLYEEYKFLRESLDERNIEIFDEIWRRKDTDYSDSLNFLNKLLGEYYKKDVVILIDEYDAPLINAYEYGYYNEALLFFKGLYGSVLKTNQYLKMGVLTGIVRVAQAGIFSDLNNLKVNTVLNKSYEEHFGLLENEVEKMLHDYNIEYKLEDVKTWYNGYRFGDIYVYNPWSILNYIDNKELRAYWVNTSSNVVIKEMLKNSDSRAFKTLEDLFMKKDVPVTISNNIALGKHLSPSEIWELLLFSGYLTIKDKIDEDEYIVRIPNQEISSFFKKTFLTILFGELQTVKDVKYALFNKDMRELKRVIEQLVLHGVSFYDTDERYENNYQMLLSGFFYALEGIYLVYPNRESGDGRPDLILEPLDKKNPAYIFELKKGKTKNIEKEAEKALEQIDENRYDSVLARKGFKEIIKIGIVFDKKKVEFKI
ncbi:AAA family ATPase [uncultured Fusobacterium sp.]|uniref:AAA family ATPase n=1 Tax=uncultured Fusobacterium sp. TaxID=159267 RepID=UPI0025D887D6|nr:AAA family ATPase [uncultured Fusobacterium sp.]